MEQARVDVIVSHTHIVLAFYKRVNRERERHEGSFQLGKGTLTSFLDEELRHTKITCEQTKRREIKNIDGMRKPHASVCVERTCTEERDRERPRRPGDRAHMQACLGARTLAMSSPSGDHPIISMKICVSRVQRSTYRWIYAQVRIYRGRERESDGQQ